MHPTPAVVLIVDDHEDSLAMYALGLLAMGFQPVTAATGEEAFARACEIQPDAIVTDLRLPGISGLDLTRRLRNEARTKNTAIVVLTGHAALSASQQADAAGCDRFIVKPCLPDALAVEVRDVLISRPHHAPEARASDDEPCPAMTVVRRAAHPATAGRSIAFERSISRGRACA